MPPVTPGYYAWVRLVTPGYAWGGYAWAKPLLVKDAMGDKIGMGEGGPIIGTLIKKALLTVGLFKTNVTGRCFYPPDVFTPWIKQDLRPKLPETALLVMDNATCHKRSETLKAIHEAQHKALFLPQYSPDLKPPDLKPI